MDGTLAAAWKSDAYAHLKAAEKALADPLVVGVFVVQIIRTPAGEPMFMVNGASGPGVSTAECEAALVGSAERLAGSAREMTALM
jgi:hypothetical protein